MRHSRLRAVATWALWPLALAAQPATKDPAAAPRLSAERFDDRIVVRVDDATFTCYRFGAGQKYPYLYPVNGPLSGVSVTTESSLPWPHHRSLFFGCDKVNGGNYWQEGNELGQIVSRGPTVAHAGPDRVEIADECEWRRPGAAPVLLDRRLVRIEAPSPRLRTILFRIKLVPQVDVRIERNNHSLFAARVVPELSAQGGGVVRNAAGASGEKGTFGVASPWCDVSGTRFGLREGIAIFDSPRNRWYPSRWFTRDYGFFSPTPFNWLEDAGLRLAAGERLELEYLVVVHAGDAEEAGIAALFADWAAERVPGSFARPRELPSE
ncbi:MAG TPA: PmoA family protein [Vicinamibacteria bacterium]|nr:PmoA family protein [Vicinamibacteria bacterium]